MEESYSLKAGERSEKELEDAKNGQFVCSGCGRAFEYKGKKLSYKIWQYASGRLLFCGSECSQVYLKSYWDKNKKPVVKKPRKVVEKRERERIRKIGRADVLLQRITENGFKCEYSGLPLTVTNMQLDHIVPVSDGGSSRLSNVAVVHRDINKMKGSMSLERFIELCKCIVKREAEILAMHAASKASE